MGLENTIDSQQKVIELLKPVGAKYSNTLDYYAETEYMEPNTALISFDQKKMPKRGGMYVALEILFNGNDGTPISVKGINSNMGDFSGIKNIQLGIELFKAKKDALEILKKNGYPVK